MSEFNTLHIDPKKKKHLVRLFESIMAMKTFNTFT